VHQLQLHYYNISPTAVSPTLGTCRFLLDIPLRQVLHSLTPQAIGLRLECEYLMARELVANLSSRQPLWNPAHETLFIKATCQDLLAGQRAVTSPEALLDAINDEDHNVRVEAPLDLQAWVMISAPAYEGTSLEAFLEWGGLDPETSPAMRPLYLSYCSSHQERFPAGYLLREVIRKSDGPDTEQNPVMSHNARGVPRTHDRWGRPLTMFGPTMLNYPLKTPGNLHIDLFYYNGLVNPERSPFGPKHPLPTPQVHLGDDQKTRQQRMIAQFHHPDASFATLEPHPKDPRWACDPEVPEMKTRSPYPIDRPIPPTPEPRFPPFLHSITIEQEMPHQ
jgi:hypothetical protein